MKKIRIIIFSIALFFALFLSITATPKNAPKEGGIYTVVTGASLKSIGTDLEREHYIRSRVLFSTLVTFLGGENSISPGDYYLAPGEGVLGVARQIAKGDHKLLPIKVTIPEGENVRDMKEVLIEKLPEFDGEVFVLSARQFEGYLFPETYFFYPKATPEDVIREMRAMFERKTKGLFTETALRGRSEKDIVVMASIIEREAHGENDRATIAGILWKRLAQGMALQVDATVAFANQVREADLRKSHFKLDSPYNTYVYKGLPPGPIANPGIEALTAALAPNETPYLYYLHDTRGTIHYAKTYAEHQKNIAKYLR
jgi:UPF0755 protein